MADLPKGQYLIVDLPNNYEVKILGPNLKNVLYPAIIANESPGALTKDVSDEIMKRIKDFAETPQNQHWYLKGYLDLRDSSRMFINEVSNKDGSNVKPLFG